MEKERISRETEKLTYSEFIAYLKKRQNLFKEKKD
jgi:hypothetical protein